MKPTTSTATRTDAGAAPGARNERPNLERFCEATRQRVARARAIDRGEARVVPWRGPLAEDVPCFPIKDLAGS